MDMYRIRDWNKHFENNRTRDLVHMQWVPIPNKQDGDGYTALLLDHENGPAHFGAWCAIVQVASKCEPRGTLMRETGKPHDARSIARITRLPVAVVAEALERLIGDEIGWMELVAISGVTETPQEGAATPQESASSRACAERNGTEENGTEENYPIDRKRASDDSFSQEEISEIAEEARRISEVVPVLKGATNDKDLVLLAATAKVRRVIDPGAIDRAVDSVRDRTPAPKKPTAYFRKCLENQCEARGTRLRDIESIIALPPTLRGRGREPPSAAVITKNLAAKMQVPT